MSANTVIALYGIAALVGILILVWFGLMFVATRLSAGVAESYGRVRERLAPMALTGAWAVALLSTAGSLYFSEVANYLPCTLCWYQRIAMYPLVLILGIAALRQDTAVRIYAIPVALVGAAISTYHYLLEWFPELDSGACSAVIPCTQVWFREFGFISLPLLALIAFGLIIAILLIPNRSRAEETRDAEEAPEASEE